METQLRFYFFNSKIENGITTKTNYYVECDWEENGNIHCEICEITAGEPERPPMNLQHRDRFIYTHDFDFNIEILKLSDTITEYFQWRGTDEMDEREVFVDHSAEGFKYCADEVKSYITKNMELWQLAEH